MNQQKVNTMKTYVADFETTTIEDDCRVWAYAICEVGNKDNISIGVTIDDFMDWCSKQKDNPKVFFHNLKFDSQFIIYWLFEHGFKNPEKPEDRRWQGSQNIPCFSVSFFNLVASSFIFLIL